MAESYSNLRMPDVASTPYDEIRETFEWEIPDTLNVATQICEAHVGDGNTALVYDEAGKTSRYTFEAIDDRATRLASWLSRRGVGRRDRVGIALSQRIETLVSHVATYKLGAIAVPISVLTGPEELEYRIEKADISTIVIGDDTLSDVERSLIGVERVIVTGQSDRYHRWEAVLESGSDSLETCETSSDEACTMTFTSGSTGRPKGVVHAHRCLAPYHLGYELMMDLPPEDAVVFTPADWAWIAGTFDTTFPAWVNGQTVVGYESRGFDPRRVFEVLEEYGVTHTLLTPTMIRMLRDDVEDPESYDLSVEVIVTGGEPTSSDLFEWVENGFDGAVLNEHYGQSEADFLTANSETVLGKKEGSIGRPIPGHDVEVVDEEGNALPAGEIGRITLRRPDPAIMLEYWDDPDATEGAFVDDRLDTGDLGYRDDDGFYWFAGRSDDLIISSGYRISPVEVERKVGEHDGVENVVVFGVPDQKRGEIVTAVVETTPDRDGDTLRRELRRLVKDDLAKYKYPRRIELVERLPTTSTGKVDRRTVRAQFVEADSD